MTFVAGRDGGVAGGPAGEATGRTHLQSGASAVCLRPALFRFDFGSRLRSSLCVPVGRVRS